MTSSGSPLPDEGGADVQATPAGVLTGTPIWAAAGPATLHLTLNPVIDPGDGPDEAVVRSVLLIVSPA
jgi:hypothetical protein